MNAPLADWLFGWLPTASRRGALRRLMTVWTIALGIALVLWGTGNKSHPLDTALVYSYAISTVIWLLSDPLRIRLGPWLHVGPPHFWAFSPRVALYMVACSTLGYAIGTAIGDAYAGRSTWDMLMQSPVRLLGFWISGLVFSGLFIMGFYQRAKAEDLRREATEAQLKLLQSRLSALGIGQVELKKRGAPFAPESLRGRLKLVPGGRPGVVIFTRQGDARLMLIAVRLDHAGE